LAILAAELAARRSGSAEEVLRANSQLLFTLHRAAAAPMLLGMIEATWLRRRPLFWDVRWLIVTRRSGRTTPPFWTRCGTAC
jgi:DNA-binding GntR family transcriptional regulator